MTTVPFRVNEALEALPSFSGSGGPATLQLARHPGCSPHKPALARNGGVRMDQYYRITF